MLRICLKSDHVVLMLMRFFVGSAEVNGEPTGCGEPLPSNATTRRMSLESHGFSLPFWFSGSCGVFVFRFGLVY